MSTSFFGGRVDDPLFPADLIPRDCLLSPREKEIINLIAAAMPVKEVASRLKISSHTVNQHLRSIYVKLQVKGRLEAILAYRTHLRSLVPN